MSPAELISNALVILAPGKSMVVKIESSARTCAGDGALAASSPRAAAASFGSSRVLPQAKSASASVATSIHPANAGCDEKISSLLVDMFLPGVNAPAATLMAAPCLRGVVPGCCSREMAQASRVIALLPVHLIGQGSLRVCGMGSRRYQVEIPEYLATEDLTGSGRYQISDQEVSRSAGQSFLNFAMKVLPRCYSAVMRLWLLQSSRMFSLVALAPRATSRSWSNSSRCVAPHTSPSPVAQVQRPWSRSQTARVTAAGT